MNWTGGAGSCIRLAFTRKPSVCGKPCFCLPVSLQKGRGGQSKGEIPLVQIFVRDNNVDQALRALKKKLQREGVFREMKLKQHFEKPSVKKAREKAEAIRRARKLARKKAQREGLV